MAGQEFCDPTSRADGSAYMSSLARISRMYEGVQTPFLSFYLVKKYRTENVGD